MIQLSELRYLLPFLVVFAGIFIALLVFLVIKNKIIQYGSSVLVLFIGFLSNFYLIDKEVIILGESLKITNVTVFFSALVFLMTLLTVLVSYQYLQKYSSNFFEYYLVVMFALLGMLVLIFANDLLLVFLGIETMSISFYILAGFFRKTIKSNESAVKYFLMGAFMTGFLLFGIAIIFGMTGETNISRILTHNVLFRQPVFLVGTGFLFIGMLFKIGIFPFHMWIPDVYEGAPTVVTGLFSTSGKIAATSFLVGMFVDLSIPDYKNLFAFLAVGTLFVSNVIALSQTNIKRLLAYSSVSSAGFVLVGLTSMDSFAAKAVPFYLFAYSLAQLGGFILVGILEQSDDGKDYLNLNLTDYRGFFKKNPLFTIYLSVFLFSLGGMPPLLGFFGKYYLFYAAVKVDLIWLAVIAILMSVIAMYYYIRIIVLMWFYEETEKKIAVKIDPLTHFTLALLGISTIILGFFPQSIFSLFNLVIK
ncbi:MAG: NADH-quinone oxidoreductase subunit N [Ignavibacteria bacterium]